MVTGSRPPRRAGLRAVAYGALPFGLFMMALAVTVTACPQQRAISRSKALVPARRAILLGRNQRHRA